MLNYDVVIIGSGVAGMTAAIYLKNANINTLLIEGSTPGGQLNNIKSIKNYPGYADIEGSTLTYNIYNQVNNLKCDYLYEEVIKTDLDEKKVFTNNKEINYKYLIIATGRKPKKLKEEKELIGKGLSYCALCDGNLYKNKEVVVFGNNKNAIEDANYLVDICSKVTLITNKDCINKDLLNEKVDVIYNNSIKEYRLINNKIIGVILEDNSNLSVEGVFIANGFVSSSDIFNIEKDNSYIITYDNYVTSNKYVYACGDIIKKNTYQISTAIGEAASCASEIIKKLKN